MKQNSEKLYYKNKHVVCNVYINYQDYQDPSVDSAVTDGHRQGKKA